MVGVQELSRYRIYELCDGHILPLLKALGDKDRVELTIRRNEVVAYITQLLSKGGMSDVQISFMLEISEKTVRRYKRGKQTKYFRNAVKLFNNPLALLLKSTDYAYDYYISRLQVETLIVEKLVLAGLRTRQIHYATGICIRKIQRIAKRIRELHE